MILKKTILMMFKMRKVHLSKDIIHIVYIYQSFLCLLLSNYFCFDLIMSFKSDITTSIIVS